MANIFEDCVERIFYCWVDHDLFIANHNYTIGSFTSSNFDPAKNDDHVMFIPNENFSQVISPFQMRLLNNYMAEYNLELSRRQYFKHYPSRLVAIFLFDSESEANVYRDRNFDHVGKRILRKAKTVNRYVYSKHDSSWVDFFRLWGTKDKETINNSCKCYWQGIAVKDCELLHCGSKWSQGAIFEILYYGRIDFIK